MKIYTQYLFWVVAVILVLSITNIFQDVLLPFVIGGAIAYLLNPLVAFLIRKGMGRSMAVVTILGIFFVIVMG
ncbi:MAG: AI-2E family transporter, partial [Pseudomonadota bacterium]